MVRVYWTSIVTSMSIAFWIAYLLYELKRLSFDEISLILLFILNLSLILIVREKFY